MNEKMHVEEITEVESGKWKVRVQTWRDCYCSAKEHTILMSQSERPRAGHIRNFLRAHKKIIN